MRASSMAEFWTRCGELQTGYLVGLRAFWQYEHGAASFDGRAWSFELYGSARA